MKKILRSMTSRRGTRHSAASALSTSAAVPSSGFVFVDNSQGGSAAVGELSHALDTALDGIDGDFDGKLFCLILGSMNLLYAWAGIIPGNGLMPFRPATTCETFADRLAVAQEILTPRIYGKNCSYWIIKLLSTRIQKRMRMQIRGNG